MVYVAGITGTTLEAIPFIKTVLKKGWIAVVFHRRGHESRLTKACFNLFGSALDLRTAIQNIEQAEPSFPIALVGSSAGSAVVVRYLGEYSHDPHVVAGIGLSPGYSIDEIWRGVEGSFFDRYILRGVKRFFVERNRELLEKRNPQAMQNLLNSATMYEFVKHAVPFSSEDLESDPSDHTFEKWLNQTDPMVFAKNISTPTICVNALDDPVCTRWYVENLGIPLRDHNNSCAMLLTEYGSHCAHQSFHNGLPENWGHKVAIDFVEGVLKEN
jgi:predicted alpha/beta-fold hydrolase